MSKKNIFFWPHTTKSKIASYRLRCKLIANELSNFYDLNIKIGLRPTSNVDILLMSKRYDSSSLKIALDLKKNGTRVILDICDNHFVIGLSDDKSLSRCNHLVNAINAVDQVVTSSDFLKEEILKFCNPISPIIVISDIVEMNNYKILDKVFKFNSFFKFLKLKWTFSKKKCSRVIWFGNHQGSYNESGMADLLRIKSELEFIGRDFDFSLTILSNSKYKFNKIFSDWDIKTYYLEWDEVLFKDVLELHDISIIPCSRNDFTYSKSDNRVTTSLANNLKVIADPVPSYLKHQEYIYIGDWKNSLISCISDCEFKNINYDVNSHNHKIINEWLKLITI